MCVLDSRPNQNRFPAAAEAATRQSSTAETSRLPFPAILELMPLGDEVIIKEEEEEVIEEALRNFLHRLMSLFPATKEHEIVSEHEQKRPVGLNLGGFSRH